MRDVILYIATSIDGFIAGNDGSLDWLDKTPNPEKNDYGYYEFYADIDTTLMGSQTYSWVVEQGIPDPYPEKTNYVFTRTSKEDNEYVSFVSGDILSFVRSLKNQEGKNIWLVGGGQVNSILLNAGLIDKMIITVMPVILGSGIPLFSVGTKETYFDLNHIEHYKNGIAQMIYTSK